MMKRRLKLTPFAKIVFAALIIVISWYIYKHQDDIKKIKIPEFNPLDDIHLRLSELSRLCHEAAEAGDEDSIKRYEREIDILAAKIWGITDEELAGVWEVMED